MARDPSRDTLRGYLASGCCLSGWVNAPGPFDVAGAFMGEIRSEDEVSVGSSGSIEGQIFAERVLVEGGGRVQGEIDAQAVVVRAGGSIAGVAVQAASLTLEAQSDADGAHFQIRPDYQRSTDGTAVPSSAPT